MHIWGSALVATLCLAFPSCCLSMQASETTSPSGAFQQCSAKEIASVGAFLAYDRFTDNVVSASCTPYPGSQSLSVAVFAYQQPNADDPKAMVIALVDVGAGQIVSSHKELVEEDAGLSIVSDSLRIDTAPYVLADGVRALGVDITSGYLPNCGDGGFGAIRKLYVVDGKDIKQITDDIYMTEWTFVQQSNWRCNSAENAPKTTITEEFKKYIRIDPAVTNGFHDMIISGTSSLRYSYESGSEKTIPSKRRRFVFRLRFDGKQYPLGEMDDAWWKWRR
jgi:hypothetical protein